MKKMKRISLLLAAFLMAALMPFPAKAASSPTKAKESVVCIAMTDKSGNVIGWGSGFAIGDPGKPVQYIATNCHVAQPTDKNGNKIPCTLTVYFSAAAGRSMTADVFWKSEDHDLAVLKLPEPTEERKALVLCPMEKVDMDDDFAALGYPATSMAADVVKFDQSDISITRGGISKQVRVNETDCYLVDLDISPGNSGGPLVNSKGEAVGINTFLIGDKARYAVTIDELIRNINKDTIPYTITGESTSFYMLLAGIGAAAVIIIIVLIVVLTGRKKKAARIPAGVSQVSQAGEAPSSRIPQAAPVDAALNTAPVTPVPEAQIPAQTPQSGIVLAGGALSPISGSIFPVSGTVKIGRDSSRCEIAFPVDTKGVSAVHCEVQAVEDGILLKDLGSTYGTFLSNGSKAEQGDTRKIPAGDFFYLGGEDNRLEVRK